MRCAIGLFQALHLETDSACQASEPRRRASAAVGASRHELRCGDAEDACQSLNLLGSESPLPAITVAFGRAHGGGGRPAHQLAELCLRQPLRRRSVLMFVPATANCSTGISSTRRRRPCVMSSPAR